MLREYSSRMNKAYKRVFHKIKKVNIKKIMDLCKQKRQNLNIQDRWLKNISNKPIPEDVRSVLSLGSKFSLQATKKDIKLENIIADVEYIIGYIPEETREIQRARVTNIITNFIHKDIPVKSPMNKWYMEAKKFLRENQDIIVLNSDKGSVTVIMERSDYENKIQTILDSKDFKLLPRDPTTTIQNACNKFIQKLSDKNYITKEQAKEMKTYNSVSPRIYGNPKVHKQGYPIRPIISSINSPLNKLSEYVANILKAAYDTNNEYYTRDTFHFAEMVKNLKIPEDHRLVSFDVVNLFGNLDKNKIIDILKSKWHKIRQHTVVDEKLFFEIVEYVLSNNYCTFRGKFYKQVFGCAMGSKVSPIVAQYVMDDLLDDCSKKLKFIIKLIKKFVDDIIMALPETEIDNVWKCLNSYCADLQFTLEMENCDQGVPFLDTMVHREKNEIKLNWYKKSTSSNKFIDYYSNHGINIKINFIKEMKNRITKICSETYLKEGLNNLFDILTQNSYPKNMLKKLLYATSEAVTTNAQNNDENNETKYYVSFPNIPGLTSKIKETFKNYNIQMATYNLKTVKELYSTLKDPIPIGLKSGVVYELNCQDCDKAYVGQTSQWVKSRMALHKSDIKKTRNRCALAMHAQNLDHRIDFEGVKVLKVERNYQRRLIQEMIQINRHKDPINKKSDTNKLSNVYCYLLARQAEGAPHINSQTRPPL
ncbi:uncharacterized protein LOC123313562 [Coccinella septempunctata]|uniref:uncharacterized protein LOC123313562 n=1 Tax=Coccinella septempunctata TaxID=41139 RepID=UPI001D0940B0|nr:uncharacterized protein LOC123313562 [Coccinella septempunctata]XP_044754437.1 uncharacterized protein LOC123313562 [Coccinella septempunctata]